MALPFKIRHADRIVAAFLLVAIAATSAVLVVVARNQGLFVRRLHYRTVFKDGGGIRAETPVKIAGIEVGTVRAVRLTDDDQVEVEFEVFESYANRLVQDPPGDLCKRKAAVDVLLDEKEKQTEEKRKELCGSRIAVSLPAGLGAFLQAGLEIKVGNRKNPVYEEGSFIPAEESEGLNELLARLQREGIVQNARDIVVQIDTLLRNFNDEEGPIQQTLQSVAAVTAKAAAGKGLVGEITTDNSPTQKKVNEAIAKLDRSLAEIEKASQDVALLTSGVSKRTDDIDRFITNLEKFSVQAKEVGSDLKVFAEDSKKIPPDVREAVKNLDERIDDLGVILKGLKKTFPFNLGEEPKDEPREGRKDGRQP